MSAVTLPDVSVDSGSDGKKGPRVHLRDPKNGAMTLCGVTVSHTVTWQAFSENPCDCCVRERQKLP